MNSLERHRLTLEMKEPDRVPVAPSFLTRVIRSAGIRQYDYHTNAEVLASAQIAHCERYDFDGLYISSDNVIMYEALGGEIVFPDENSYPFWTTPVIENSQDLARCAFQTHPVLAGCHWSLRQPVSRWSALETGDLSWRISIRDRSSLQIR